MIQFRDLRRETIELEDELRDAIDEVLRSGRFVGGEAIEAFEREFAAFCGAADCIGVGSGTDAIEIALRAVGVGQGDEVITAANTCLPTVAAIAASGATPVLADVDRVTLTLDPAAAAAAMSPRTRAVVPVHLYGRAAHVAPLLDLGVRIVEDAAQAHGSAPVADVAAFSFYPTKNLGALGDAGAVVTSDAEVAERARLLREYGGGEIRADQSRLDTLQAAVLRVKLRHLPRWTKRRRELAGRYDEAFGAAGVADHVYHLYVIRSRERDTLRARLAERGVETQIHYARAVHQHPAWADLGHEGLRESERACAEVLSLPLYPQLTDGEADAVIEAVLAG